VKKQLGIATGWLYLIGLVVLVVAVTGLIHAGNSFVASVEKKGYDRGVNETTASYAKRDNDALVKAQTRITFLEEQARDRERADAKKNAELAAQRAKEKRDAEKQRAADYAAAAAGALVLRDPGQNPAPGPNAGGRGASAPSFGPGSGNNGAPPGQLSPKVTGDLFALVDDADDLAKQLASAQARIRQDLTTCNAGP
jgi:hypothetical protein